MKFILKSALFLFDVKCYCVYYVQPWPGFPREPDGVHFRPVRRAAPSVVGRVSLQATSHPRWTVRTQRNRGATQPPCWPFPCPSPRTSCSRTARGPFWRRPPRKGAEELCRRGRDPPGRRSSRLGGRATAGRTSHGRGSRGKISCRRWRATGNCTAPRGARCRRWLSGRMPVCRFSRLVGADTRRWIGPW